MHLKLYRVGNDFAALLGLPNPTSETTIVQVLPPGRYKMKGDVTASYPQRIAVSRQMNVLLFPANCRCALAWAGGTRKCPLSKEDYLVW